MSLLQKILIRLKIFLERMRGLQFTSITPLSQLDLDESLVHQGSSSCDKYLLFLFKSINIKNKETILDVGCAKGGAMYCMSKYPFSKIDGIELSEILSNVAKKNFFKLKEDRVTVMNLNATCFNDYCEYDFLYFYNPFPKQVFDKVMLKIVNGLDNKKEIIIIYNNPVCHQEIVDCGFYKIKGFPDMHGNGIFLYSNFRESKRLSML